MSDNQQQAETTNQWPVLPTNTDIAVKVAVLEEQTKKLEDGAANLLVEVDSPNGNGKILVIANDEVAAEATDFLAFATRFMGAVEKRRLEYTAPAREFTTALNREVGLYTTRCEAAKSKVATALLRHQQRKRDEAAKAEEDRKKKEADEALAAAAALEASGNTAGANRVLEVAASAPARRSVTRPTETRGTYTGRKAAIRSRWVGEVVSLRAMLQAVIDGKLSADGITIGQAFLNQVATAHQKEEVIYGIKVKKEESLG